MSRKLCNLRQQVLNLLNNSSPGRGSSIDQGKMVGVCQFDKLYLISGQSSLPGIVLADSEWHQTITRPMYQHLGNAEWQQGSRRGQRITFWEQAGAPAQKGLSRSLTQILMPD